MEIESTKLGAAVVLKNSPRDREDPTKQRWLYWALLIIVMAFVLLAVAFMGGKNMSARAPTGDDMMNIEPVRS
ncbi:hypothetical protein [Pseudaminobacter soli (ex Li et al. 2025)]|uniref:Uncharacterized protein n=1 Tax=Pseudaminobacter soli (ex Li et al. 2025) TaxID=1295366 RepID=A0A2P7RJY7_9HYPH|nr:hypothetical protein [Mesorhizobium soli]PSJ50517.1 hypothetical protein C7I85_30005 [Mesorhizobium soli]